ncbi:MAG: S-adenosylmethionine:tRNA ribosyltransferase-isomerase [Anaerolineae bacterium]|nr:S-adenosylmethionine:tRNA ribosyltransferase-isomerase [Anaerolineae bacterium]
MKREALIFDRPDSLAAIQPTEARGIARDEVLLLISSPSGHQHAHFYDLPNYLRAGDLMVINRSATLPSSLPASSRIGDFTLNLSTHYGHGMWLAEPRWSPAQPGPLPLAAGDIICVDGVNGRLIAPFPGLPRLWFIQFDSQLETAMAHVGQPIRYAYLNGAYPLSMYQTVFATQPGSAEMPSASYPFTERVIEDLHAKGIQLADLTLHTGVSSLEVEQEDIENHPLYPEPFEIPAATAEAINAAKAEGRRVIAVGTTVIRAVESAWAQGRVKAIKGFTRLYVQPARGLHVVDGLITGLHDPVTSHLAMLYTLAGEQTIKDAYAEAVREGYLWHEFGDSHLILTRD